MRSEVSYSGPIPQADEIARYESILPGAAERLFGYADRQQAHRQGLENRVVDSNIALAQRGQVLGFVIGLVGIAAAAVLVLLDHVWPGLTIFFGDVVALVGVFVYGRRAGKRELRVKDTAPEA